MKRYSQLLIIILLVVSIATALFSLQQVGHFFTKREVVVGSWGGEQTLEVNLFDENNTSLDTQILGVSVSDGLISPQFEKKSYHGYLFDKYFQSKDSPLTGYGEYFVSACKKYQTPSDCTLLPAIAKVETNFCKTDISAKQYNCWGFGGSGPNRIIYKSFPESIDNITRRLKQGYGDRFFTDPTWGGLTYCGAHCVNWGKHVQAERININNYFKANGHSPLF